MKIDERITKLAENVLKNSVKLKKGEKIYIEAFSASTKDLFNEFIRVATKMGAVPFYMYNDNSFVKNLMSFRPFLMFFLHLLLKFFNFCIFYNKNRTFAVKFSVKFCSC